MSQRTEQLAVMFADICDSTGFYERLGDEIARRLVKKCLTLLIEKMHACQGTLIQTIGDEIMCTFPSAQTAMNAACAMQSSLEHVNHSEEHPMHVRIGFHYGDVACEAGLVYGDTVNTAARVAALARADQILTTLAAVNSLPPGLRQRTDRIMGADLKGKQGTYDLFRVIWETDEVVLTRVRACAPTNLPPLEEDSELTLRYHSQSCTLNGQHKSAMLGRDETCEIRVSEGYSSRRHALIEWLSGKFVIADQSTNGTYIRFANWQTVRLSREKLVLRGSGSISLGQSYEENPVDLVEFSITA
jgi:adenylate cyclase